MKWGMNWGKFLQVIQKKSGLLIWVEAVVLKILLWINIGHAFVSKGARTTCISSGYEVAD